MAEAPTEDVMLTERDAIDIFEELLEAINKAYVLGLAFELPPHEVDAIKTNYSDPRDCLLQVILTFLRQAEPRPTWKVIVDALRSPAVNLTALAERVEAAHFPDLTATQPPPPATGPSSPDCILPQTPPVDSGTATSSEAVKKTIEELKTRFRALKDDTRECLEKQKVPVKRVADSLMSLSPDDDDRHKMFTESHISDLFQAPNIATQFGTMNSHWNYLDPSLLDHLVRDFNLEEVKGEMETYKSDLGQFRKKTPLTLFCRAQKRKRVRLTPNFQEVVAEFDWRNDVMLEDVEQFRQEYASHYGLHEFAMMVAQVRPGSFIITWFVPESVVEKLKGKVPRAILKKYSVTKLEIAGTCVYRLRKPQEAVPSTSSGPVSAATVTVSEATPSLSPPKPASEEDYLFVEAPSEEFYCPVTLDLLLEPHLTSCCGKHLSQEAATRIQAGGGACPLCKAPRWSTMLDKHFQREAKSVFVFHRHEEKGCGWQGELGTLDSHVKSCPMRHAPHMTELLKLSHYGGHGTQVPHQEQSPLRVGALQAAYRTVPSAKSAAHTSQEDPMTPLTAAARKGDIQEVLKLLQNKEDPNPAADSHCTPLKEVSRRGDTEMALVLLKAGADPNYVTDDWTALMEACRVGKTEMVELLINHGADPNTVNRSYWTALMAASNRGHYEAVDILLQRGANPNMQDNTGWSALLGAVYMGHVEIVLRLLEAGARPDIQDKNQTSAIMLAVVNFAKEKAMDALLASKPDLDHQDKFGETALTLACKMRNPNFVRKLLSKGANPNICNKDGDTPLLIATALSHAKIHALSHAKIHALSEAKINVKGVDEEEMVEALLQAGADQTKGVERPLILAAYVGNGRIIQLLLKYGADIYQRDENGVAAFEVAEMEMFRDLSNTLNPEQLSSRTSRGKCKWTKKRLRSALKQFKRGPLFLYGKSRSMTGVVSLPEKFRFSQKVEDTEEMAQRKIDEAKIIHAEVEDTEEMAPLLIDEAMKSGSLRQRNVVGVITGPIGAGKTTLLCRLFGEPPPDLYTSTGVAEQSIRGLLHHTVHLSAGAWQRLSHSDIRELLAPLIKAGMSEADVHALASRLMHNINPTSAPSNRLDPEPSSTSATASVPSEAEAFLSPTSLPEKSPTFQEMVPLVKSTAPTLKDLVLEMVHMIDTGGQPELLQVMPSFIHNADLAIALLNLEYSLSEHQQVDYHEEGVAYRRKIPFMVTGRDIILKLASSLHGKKSLHEPFRLLIVATHRDCVEGDLEARVETLNRELRRLLLPSFKKQLFLFESPNKIAFVLDLKNPDDSDKRALELIRREVGKPGLGKTFETPISFFVFEQDLLKFAESVVRRDILSLDECKMVGAQLKMSQETVVAALVLFHRQNTFLYFRHVLPNHVFIKPQVPLDIINSIVSFSYKKLQGVPAELASQLENGIITEELLSYGQISRHFQTGVYEVQDAIRLFCHTLIIAPLHLKEDAAHPVPNSEREYLMMCLKPSIPDQELHRYIPTSSDTVPLVVRFSSGCVPLGCFGSTISCLLSEYRWEVVRGEDGTPKCLAHNIASLHDPQLLVNILLVDFTQYLQVHVSCDLGIHELPPNTCSLVLTNVFGAIEKVFEVMRLDRDKMGISPAVLCPCTKVREKHFASFQRRSKKYFLCCSQTTSLPDEKQKLWMGSETAHTEPTLPQLMELKVPVKVGGNYRKFGTLLLNDDTGILVDNARESCHYQPDKVVTDILRKWLQEGPTPVTWDNLIQVLRKCDLQTLADYVRDTHTMVT